MTGRLRVGVMGAGSVGCWLGGALVARGIDVKFVGRERAKGEIEAFGLSMTDLDGKTVVVPRDEIVFATQPSALADRDVVLVCVKSAQTSEAADALAAVLAPGA